MFSFVIIGRNESWRLEKCLSSIRRIAEKELICPFEIIYVDSQSTDNSIELSKKYTDKTFLITGECSAAIGRNIGAKEAKGEILFFMDGDMELREGVLSSILNEKGRLVYPFMSGVEEDYLYDNDWNLKGKRERRKYHAGEDTFKATTGGLFAIEKRIWEEVGGMDTRFLRSQDMDFGFRLSAMGIPLLRKGQLWVNHHTVFYAVRNNVLKMTKYSALLLRKHFFSKTVQLSVLKNNYSAYILVFCLFFVLCVRHYLGILVLIPYVLIICYRTIRTRKRTSVKVDYLRTSVIRVAKDIIFIFSFLTYYPNHPLMSYKEV